MTIIKLEKDEESLRKRIRKLYIHYPRKMAKRWCELLVEEDKIKPSEVYLWWGGEPNSDSCYAFLTLYFEVDPEDIGTPRFDRNISRNLKTIINIGEKESSSLSFYKEYEPYVLRSLFLANP